MSPPIGIAIGTYGSRDFWAPLVERALQSVFNQTCSAKPMWVHHDSLHEARNAAARKLVRSGCDWLIFLDADDELEPDYVYWMSLAASLAVLEPDSRWPVFYPSTRAVMDGVPSEETHLHTQQNLLRQNFVNIGAMHKASMHKSIGGFDDWPVLEDWAYWTKAWVHGAEFVPVGDAVYKAHLNSERPGRNVAASQVVLTETCSNIRAMYSFLAKQQGYV